MPSPARIWDSLSAEEHEFQYNPQKAFPHFARHGAARAPLNEQVRRDLKSHLDVRYGGHKLHTLDIFPAVSANGKSPVHIFLHGGYWRAQDKQNFSFVAGALVPLGITTVVANYELCPESTLDGVVDSALAAFEWTCRNIGGYGGNPASISLSGHSAGAHLAAEIMSTNWASRGVDASVLHGVTLISGIFDPLPTMSTTVNEQVRLSDEIARRHDVERRTPLVRCPVALIAGAEEPEQWIDQSFRYYHHLRRHAMQPELHVLAAHDHFGILADYLDGEGATVRAIRRHALDDKRLER